VDQDQFERQACNHWVHFLEGNQRELLTKCSHDDFTPSQDRALLSAMKGIPWSRQDYNTTSLRRIMARKDESTEDLLKAIKNNCMKLDKCSIKPTEVKNKKVYVVGVSEKDEKMRDYFRTLVTLKISGEAIHPMQFYFGSPLKTTQEIEGFVKRVLWDPEQRWYFFFDIHLLSTEMKNDLVRFCKKYSEDAALKNKNLVLFTVKESLSNIYHDLTKHDQLFEILSLFSPKKFSEDEHLRNLHQSYISKIQYQVVTSDFSGLGKTTYIENASRKEKRQLLPFFLSGEVQQETIEKRIELLELWPERQDRYNLHIKLDMMDNMIVNSDLVDQILFRICYLKMYPYQGGWYSFEDVDRFYIEVGNSYKQEILHNISFLRVKPDSSTYNIPSGFIDDQTNWDSSILESGVEMKATAVCKCWLALRHKLIGTLSMDSILFDGDAKVACDDIQMKRTLKEVFITQNENKRRIIEQGNFRQLNNLVSVLHEQLRQFDAVSGLNPDTFALDTDPLMLAFKRNLETTRLVSVRLIFELANELIWSTAAEVRKDSITTFEQYKRMLNEGFTNVQVQKLPKWDQGNKLNIIFNEGCMKIVYKEAKQVSQEIKQVIKDQTAREFVDYNQMGTDEKEKLLLREIFEALNLSQHLDQRYFSTNQMQELSKAPPNTLQNMKFQTLFLKLKKFKMKGYTLTIDNYLKILNIAQRAQLNIPIVIMGATGCGKTYMIDFIANFIFKEQYLCFTLHSGVTELEIEENLIQAIELAEESERVWLLFDEFNTSPFQCLISEIMTERRCTFSNRPELKHIPENIIFVAACNPFRLKVNNSAVGLVHEASKLVLSHRVYPIPQSLIDYIWDFGQLTDEVETEYIRSMITNDKEFKRLGLGHEDLKVVAHTIIICQNYLRASETDSSVSLRDVQRYIDLFIYFHKIIGQADNNGAMVMASYLCYFLRIDSKPQRKELEAKLQSKLLRKIQFEAIFLAHAKEFIDEIKSMKIIPENISINTPLIENLLAICVATMKNIPLIICGKPGTSKTVAINIAFDMFNASDEKKRLSRYLSGAPKCININFWGSITTTSQGIIHVFEDAKKQRSKIAHKSRLFPDLLQQEAPKTAETLVTVVFDEIGLAEIAESNPLKVLHSRLEDRDMKVGFIGLSNWKLDLSKMNRVIYVARPDMDSEDLYKTCQLDNNSSKVLKDHLKALSEAYAKFRKQECGEKDFHPNFHGSRDFYQMIRLIKQYEHITRESGRRTSELTQRLIESSIERNFSGKMAGTKRTSIELIKLYRKELSLGTSLSIPETNSLDLIYQNLIDEDARHLMIFSEALEIEEMVVAEIKRFLKDVRRKPESKFVFLNNSRGKEDLNNIFYRLQVYAKEGYTLVMKNLDTIYPCLYDLLNQNYLASDEVNGPKGCYLFNDNTKHKVTVHKDFKCILLMEREDSAEKNYDFEKKQQPPFLNRFEKHLVMFPDLIKDSNQLEKIQEEVDKLLGENKRINDIYTPCQLFHNLSKELIYSRGMSKESVLKRMKLYSADKKTLEAYYCKLFGIDDSADNSMEEDNEHEYMNMDDEALDVYMKKKFDSLHSRNVILARYLDFVQKKTSESEFKKKTLKMRTEFLANHRFDDLESLLRDVDVKKSKISHIVFTFSSPWVIKDILENLKSSSKPGGESLRNRISFVQASDVVAKGIVEREDIFKEIIKGKESILVIQFKEKCEWRYIQDFKYKLETLINEKRLILVAHTSIEDVQNKLLVPTSINLITENWEMVVIDNLKGCGYDKFFERLESTLEDIRKPMLTSKTHQDKAYCADIIFDAIKDFMISITNNYEGLVRTSKFLALVSNNRSLEDFILDKMGTETKPSFKKKMYQLIAEDKGTSQAARNFLDCEDFIKQRIRLEFSKAIKNILKDINKKVGFESILKTSIVSKEFQEEKIHDWVMMVVSPPFNYEVPLSYKHSKEKKLKLKKFKEKIKSELMKASDLVKQAKVAFKKIKPNESEMFETISKHDRVKNQLLSSLHSMVLTNAELSIDPELMKMHEESTFEDKLFAALQLCEPFVDNEHVDQTLRILSVMIQKLEKMQGLKALTQNLERLTMMALVLLRVYKDDILFLATLLYRSEHKATSVIEKTLERFQEDLTITCDLHDLLLFQNVANQDSVPELIDSYKLYLDSWREETSESLSQEAAAKLMLKFFRCWSEVQDISESNEIQTLVNQRVVIMSTVQNMILEIIQLAGEKSKIKRMSLFLTSSLLEILEFMDFEGEQIDEGRRQRAFVSLAGHIFEDKRPMDMEVMILANFNFENYIRDTKFNSMIHMQKVFDRFKNGAANDALKMKLKKYYFYFIDCRKSREKVSRKDWLGSLLKIEPELESALRCKNDTHLLKLKEMEAIWVFKL
jgi:hypothetical protein